MTSIVCVPRGILSWRQFYNCVPVYTIQLLVLIDYQNEMHNFPILKIEKLVQISIIKELLRFQMSPPMLKIQKRITFSRRIQSFWHSLFIWIPCRKNSKIPINNKTTKKLNFVYKVRFSTPGWIQVYEVGV